LVHLLASGVKKERGRLGDFGGIWGWLLLRLRLYRQLILLASGVKKERGRLGDFGGLWGWLLLRLRLYHQLIYEVGHLEIDYCRCRQQIIRVVCQQIVSK